MTATVKQIRKGDLCIDPKSNVVMRCVDEWLPGEPQSHQVFEGCELRMQEIGNPGIYRPYALRDVEEGRVERLYRFEDTLAGLAERGGRWADQVFPKRTPWITLVRLAMRELPELYEKPHDRLEIADAVILAIDVAYQQGIDIQAATIEKMDMNDGRVWEHRADGMMYHVKQAGDVHD